MNNSAEKKNKKPSIEYTLKQGKKTKVYLLIYAAISVFILWIYPSDWLGFVLVFVFGVLAFGRINKIFSGSDWTMRKQNKEEQDSSDGRP